MGNFTSSDVKVDLVINKVTVDTYRQLSSHGMIDPNQLYIVEDTKVDTFGKRIVDVGEPVLSSDAATKGYVDSAAESMLSYARKILSADEWNVFEANDRALNWLSDTYEQISGEFGLTMPPLPEGDDPFEGPVHLRDFMIAYNASGPVSIMTNGVGTLYGDDPGTEESGTYLVTLTELDRNQFGSGTFYCRKIKLEEVL